MDMQMFGRSTAAGWLDCLSPYPTVVLEDIYCSPEVFRGCQVLPTSSPYVPGLRAVLHVSGFDDARCLLSELTGDDATLWQLIDAVVGPLR